jgi:ABC-type oligopeptide transport system ATPase subunit
METIISLKNVTKSFKQKGGLFFHNKYVVLDCISLDVYKGKTLAIMGESGCGKSTLAKTIMRLHEPDSGKILFMNDQNEMQDSRDIKLKAFCSTAQMVFQDPYSSLNPKKKIWEIISSPLTNFSRFSRGELRDVAREYLNIVGLDDMYLDVFPHKLSGGQRQRVNIARALAIQPEVLILDEPLSALDISVQAQMINLLLYLQKKFSLTYVLISHDASVVRHMSDFVAVMYSSKVVEYDQTELVFRSPQHAHTKSLISTS